MPAFVLGAPAADPDSAPGVIENDRGAAFPWLAYGCQRHHGKHKEHHTQLARYLRDLGEPDIALRWNRLERAPQGAMYAHDAALVDGDRAGDEWQAIRAWATT